MAIATKQIASGILAQNRRATGYIPVSFCSDWFESHSAASPGLEDATALRISVHIEKADTTSPESPVVEQLELHLFESDDLHEWGYVTELTGLVATSASLYGTDWPYVTERKKYFRIQFQIDLDQAPPTVILSLPYPDPPPGPHHSVSYQGNCWVTVYHKRP